jgi:hypothetical protein
MTGLKYILILATLISSSAFAETPYVICKNQKTVRTLRIDKVAGKCQTVYTKNGQDQVIGSGMNPSSCKKFLEDVSENLTKSGWKCREPKDSQVSQLDDKVQ